MILYTNTFMTYIKFLYMIGRSYEIYEV